LRVSRFVQVILAVGCSVGLLAAGNSTVRLRNGSSIEGEILQEKTDRIVIDLGFMVVTVPRDEVASIVPADAREDGESRVADEADEIFHSEPFREELSVKQNLERCGPSVVEVRTPTGQGSGFVIHPDGYVVTNHHVIAGERRIVITRFRDTGRELEKVQFEHVVIVATSPFTDLALLRIEGAGDEKFDAVPLGDSDDLRQGQSVFAIGSPLGFERSVSQGIVSLRNRPMGGRLFIQSTTQLNPGNFGGPLFNLRGEAVGVNNLKIAAPGVEGLNFSIGANALKTFLRNRDAFAFHARNPNAGFRYNAPPHSIGDSGKDAGR